VSFVERLERPIHNSMNLIAFRLENAPLLATETRDASGGFQFLGTTKGGDRIAPVLPNLLTPETADNLDTTSKTLRGLKLRVRKFGSVQARISVSRTRRPFLAYRHPFGNSPPGGLEYNRSRSAIGRATRKTVTLLCLPQQLLRVSVPHNPLAPGSSPGGSTIFKVMTV
jgi:hypothetical protein